MNTKHSMLRAQQRGIPPLIKDWLNDYGKELHDGNGAIIKFFTNDSIRKMERDFGREPLRRLSEFFRCYMVLGSNGEIVTVGKRYQNSRFNHV